MPSFHVPDQVERLSWLRLFWEIWVTTHEEVLFSGIVGHVHCNPAHVGNSHWHSLF